MSVFSDKNSIGARQLFVERNVYDGLILAELDGVTGFELETRQIKDFLSTEKLLFGRVDSRGNPILLDTQNLRSFATAIGGSNTSAINFVVESFKSMKSKFDSDLRKGVIDPNSVALGELDAKRGFVDPRDAYAKYKQVKKQGFIDYVNSEGLLNHIVDFDSFAQIYMDYVRATAARAPFTQTMYILTVANSVLSSGLAVEIYEGDCNDDNLKFDLFYNDPNFEYLKNLAYGHGFMIDKHIPWRLVADINSPNISRFLQPELPFEGSGLAALSLFYNRPHLDDLEDILDMMIDTYNTIAEARPFTTIKESRATTSINSPVTVYNNCKKTKIINRLTVSLDYASDLPTSYWIDKYVKIRNAETGLGYDDATVNTIIKNTTQLINNLDIFTGMRYIASKFDNVAHLEGSLFYDITRIEMSQDPNATESSVKERVQRSVQDSNFVQY